MPGIAGIIRKSPAVGLPAQIAGMTDRMCHESFYRAGTYCTDDRRIGLGWVVHPGGFSDGLPAWNEARNLGLIFLGEHYADAEDGTAPPDLRSLVHAFHTSGSAFYRRLNGHFSGAIWDTRAQSFCIFNDRYGLGRVYFRETSDAFYFASEAKALFEFGNPSPRLDSRSLAESIVCGCPLEGRTLFSGISILPPASVWKFERGHLAEKARYFNLAEWESQSILPPDEYYHRLKDTFTRVLPRYFRGPQPLALSLTGGLDSRMVIAGASPAPGRIPCYTFSGAIRECADVRLARAIARRCHQPFQTIEVGRAFFPRFLELARKCVYVTDGSMDVSGAVSLYANQLARDIAPVRMTGNYGSEVLRQHVAFKPATVSTELFVPEFKPLLDEAAATYRAARAGRSTLSFVLGVQMPWHHFCRFAEEQSQLTVRAPYLDNDLVPLAYRAPPGPLLNKQLAYRYTTDLNPALAGIPTDRGALSPPRFVPHKLLEFSQELLPHTEYLFDYGMPHWLARLDRLAGPLRVDRLLLGRQKYYHFRSWYRHELAPAVKEILLDDRTLGRPYYRPEAVRRAVLAHTSGQGNYTTELHRLLTIELIERYLVGSS